MLSIFPMHSHANRFVQVLFYVWFAICHSRVWTTLGSTIRAPLQGLRIVELVRTAWSKVFQSVSHRGLERTRRGHCHLRGMLPRLLSCLLLVWIVGACLSRLAKALQTADGSYSSSFEFPFRILLLCSSFGSYSFLCFVLPVFFLLPSSSMTSRLKSWNMKEVCLGRRRMFFKALIMAMQFGEAWWLWSGD